MNRKEFNNLISGDIIKHKSDHKCYVITAHYGNRITAVTSVDLTNPIEWELVCKHKNNR